MRPEDGVVVVATAVVDDRATYGRRNRVHIDHQALDRLGRQVFLAGQRLVQIIDIGLVVAAPVDLHGFGVDVRLERVEGVGELFKGERLLCLADGWQQGGPGGAHGCGQKSPTVSHGLILPEVFKPNRPRAL